MLYVCENNFYGIGTSVGRASALADIHKRSCGYDIPAVRIDGMDVMAVHEAVKWGAEWVREHSRPYLVEAITYRFRVAQLWAARLHLPSRSPVWHWRQPPDRLLQPEVPRSGSALRSQSHCHGS